MLSLRPQNFRKEKFLMTSNMLLQGTSSYSQMLSLLRLCAPSMQV